MTSHDLKVPISLSYHSTGLQVDEMASSAGLGWSLNAGGAMSRTVFGLDDFGSDGYATKFAALPRYGTVPEYGHSNTPAQEAYDLAYRSLEEGTGDLEPDLYTFSLNGRSGRMVFGQDGRAHPIPYQALAITTWNSGNPMGLGYTFVDEQGIGYWFDAAEYTETVPDGACGQFDPKQPRTGHVSGYALRWMISPINDTVKFVYEADVSAYRNPTSSDLYDLQPGCTDCRPISTPLTPCRTQTQHQGVRLRQITTATGQRAVFTYDPAERLDLVVNHRLQSIRIYDPTGSQVRCFTLHHSYFSGPDNGDATALSRPLPYRLRLDSLQEQGKPPHVFSYYHQNDPFPSRLDYGQDWWGYYNGRSNATLAPAMQYGGRFYTGADRSVDTVRTRFGVLQGIRYPTGGRTVFDFEPNRLEQAPTYRDSVVSVSAQAYFYDQASRRSEDEHQIQFTLTRQESVKVSYRFDTSNPAPQIAGGIAFANLTGGQAGVNLRYACAQGTNCHDEFLVTLGPGTYTVFVHAEANTEPSAAYANLMVTRMGLIRVGTAPQLTGGCRIRRITDYTQQNRVASVRSFTYTDPRTGLSSGVGGVDPKLWYEYAVKHYNYTTGLETNRYLVRTARTTIPQNSIPGGIIGYTCVTETVGAGGEGGKSEYFYSGQPDLPTYTGYPFTPPISYDWARGQLLKRLDYKKNGAAWQLIKSVRQEYIRRHDREDFLAGRPLSVNEAIVPGACVAYITPPYTSINNNGTGTVLLPAQIQFNWYFHISAWQYLHASTEKLYDPVDTTRFMATVTRYRYDNAEHLQATQVTHTTSSGDSTWTTFSYPLDFGHLPGVQSTSVLSIQRLQQRHQLTSMLETQQGVWKGGVRLTTGSQFTAYALSQPWRSYRLQLPAPVIQSPLAIIQAGNLTLDPRFVLQEEVELRDEVGNPVQVRQQQQRTSFVWGYAQGLLVAQVKNAALAQMGYTSFEATALDSWTGSISGIVTAEGYTGNNSYRLAAGHELRRSGLLAATYVVSMWVKEGTGAVLINGVAPASVPTPRRGWRLQQAQVDVVANGVVSISGTAQIDEVRLHPVGAQMTTYTHYPLIGMASQTDPNGRTTTYEYDALGRLLRTRDEQGRVLSQQQYHYAQH